MRRGFYATIYSAERDSDPHPKSCGVEGAPCKIRLALQRLVSLEVIDSSQTSNYLTLIFPYTCYLDPEVN